MNVLQLRSAEKTTVTRYESSLADAALLADGHGEAHVHVIEFQPGGVIGPHEAGFGQLFCFVDGTGWVAGPDGCHVPLAVGDIALIRRGEIHSKGSDQGSIALMVQVRHLEAVHASQPFEE